MIERILPDLDQYLLDIKHMDPDKHREFTGKSNELMLENAKKIAASGLTELSCLLYTSSLGNESYAGDVLKEMNAYYKETDPDRLVHYEGVVHNRAYEDCISDMEMCIRDRAISNRHWRR